MVRDYSGSMCRLKFFCFLRRSNEHYGVLFFSIS